ncbi:MAG: septum formation initiator [Peptococcaceae bacterium]|nr:septum formation initiator [Peptococcaceae bacterium]
MIRKEKKLYSEEVPRLYVLNNEEQAAKTIRKRRKIPKYFKLLSSVLGVYLLFAFLAGGYEIWQLKKQLEQIDLEKKVLLEQRTRLEQDIKALQEPEIIERIARESLGLVKPGETVIVPAIPGKNIPKPKEVNSAEIAD